MTGSDLGGRLRWRRVTEADFGLLRDWLEEPVVRRWWNHETSPAAVERDFGPAARGEEPCEDLLVSLDGRPVGLVQRCRWDDYPVDLETLSSIVDVPGGALTIDYLLASAELRGRGLGTSMVRAVTAESWSVYPEAPSILVPVVAGNLASWRTLEKAGYRRVGEGDLEPDNPEDPQLHYVYRLDRPS